MTWTRFFFFISFIVPARLAKKAHSLSMFKFARNILSALQGKRSLDASDSEEETERPDLKRNKSEDVAAATNSGSPDVADSATAGVRSETAAAPKFNYVLKAKNLPQGNVKPTKKYFADLGFSRIDKIPSKDFATITFDVSHFPLHFLYELM